MPRNHRTAKYIEFTCPTCGTQRQRRKAQTNPKSKNYYCNNKCVPRPGPKPTPVADRFWPKVQKTEHCWVWIGARLPGEYGEFDTRRAHRVSWELHHGTIPEGLHVCHKCDNPPCVRPDHLFLGTANDNIQDCIKKGRRNHMLGDGHPRRRNPALVKRGEQCVLARLKEADVTRIISMLAAGETCAAIAPLFGVDKATIRSIRNGKTWAHVPR